jgi:hypothetical protein
MPGPRRVRDGRPEGDNEMNAITSSRGGGKTARMIFEMLKNPNAVMVVHSHRERQRIIGIHPDLKGRIYTFDDFRAASGGFIRPDTPVFVDNADDFLRRHFGNVTTFSYSSDD